MVILIGMTITPVALSRMIERLIITVVAGAALTASVVGAPVALVLALIALSNMANRLNRFIDNIPFMATWMVAYSAAWKAPPLLWSYAAQWSLPAWVLLVCMGVIGAGLLILLASVWKLLSRDLATSTVYTLIWGWYCLFFFVLMLSPGDDDVG